MITAMPRIAIAIHDFEQAVSVFKEEFGMPVADLSSRTVPSLGAHVAMCQPVSGSNIELMAPADPDKPLSQALQKFLAHRGEGIYAMMLEAANPDAEAVELLDRGLEVLPLMHGAGGRDIHPRSTHGVLVRIYPNDSVAQPKHPVSRAPNFSGIQKVVVATRDASAVTKAYAEGLGLAANDVVMDAKRGVCSIVVRPPKGGCIELVSPVDTKQSFAAEIDTHLRTHGEGIWALTLSATGEPAERDFQRFGTRFLVV
ncbi:MAG: hypothetical protein GKR90_13745 [Pseudomonadales bacterium]|nr:hypothetical protein [Pseudomonadales bacterium]